MSLKEFPNWCCIAGRITTTGEIPEPQAEVTFINKQGRFTPIIGRSNGIVDFRIAAIDALMQIQSLEDFIRHEALLKTGATYAHEPFSDDSFISQR